MASLLAWIRNNKLAALLLLVIAIYFGKQFATNYLGVSSRLYAPSQYSQSAMEAYDSASMGAPAGLGFTSGLTRSKSIAPIPPIGNSAPPQAGVSDRLVVQNSQLSLVVKNVREAVDQIVNQATQAGGYMVNSNLSQPEEAPYATITVRIPADRLSEVLSQYRSLAVKVTFENLTGHDVTDQYLDIDTRLARLRKTQAKFEELLDQAVKFEDILRAQQEVLNIQNQIDQLIGQQQYLEQTAKLALVTLNVSTDEFALPYAPSDNFRPEVIFKQAIRSLVLTLRGLATNLIWLGVYAAIWIPALFILFLIRRWWQKHSYKKI